MMNEKQLAMYDVLCELNGEQVLTVLLDWHGTQLLSNGLYDEMVNDGLIEGVE